jgi:FXSXX-COOH protein
MDDGATHSADAAAGGSALPDLTGMPIEALFADDSVLGAVIGRIVSQLGQPAENYAAHSTST